MLETTGQLEQLTGLVGISAGEAADLITAGILPVTEQLGVAMQDTLGNLESSMAATSETAAANQEIIQAAMDGTLTGAEDMSASTTSALDMVAAGFGAKVPESVDAASEATTEFTTQATEGVMQLHQDYVIPFEEELNIISGETVPLLVTTYVSGFDQMCQATDRLLAKLPKLIEILNKIKAANQDGEV